MINHKILSCFAAAALVLSPFAANAAAAAYNPGFTSLTSSVQASESAFELDYGIYLSADTAFVSDILYDQTSEEYPLQRFNGDVDYSLDTTTLTVTASIEDVTDLRAISYDIDIADLYPKIDFSTFDTLELAFLVNCYGQPGTAPVGFNQTLDFVCEFTGQDSSGSYQRLYLPISQVTQVVSSSGSGYYNAWSVFRLAAYSDVLYQFSEYTDARLSIHIIGRDATIMSNLREFDFGLYSGQIGYGSKIPGSDLTVDPWEIYNPWDDLPDLEPWDPPSPSGDVTLLDFFEVWNTSSIVQTLITPIMLTSIGYFAVRVILWKEV